MRVLLLALLLTACGQQEADTRTVKLTLVKQGAGFTAELHKHCGDDMILHPLGCAKAHGTSCNLVVPEVRGGYDDKEALAVWGHELRHCFRGPVHD